MNINGRDYKVDFHTCGDEHPCPEDCLNEGICGINY